MSNRIKEYSVNIDGKIKRICYETYIKDSFNPLLYGKNPPEKFLLWAKYYDGTRKLILRKQGDLIKEYFKK